ncbi:hypothetical protein A8144_09435 [Mycobacterium leprae 3125609]|nr:hypothetical protein A8144_09435 [Mycobacterium leprae 3125609]OAX70902.1 hypothetical protein A3216_09340 [Mycobacterium leprae 7935681]
MPTRTSLFTDSICGCSYHGKPYADRSAQTCSVNTWIVRTDSAFGSWKPPGDWLLPDEDTEDHRSNEDQIQLP